MQINEEFEWYELFEKQNLTVQEIWDLFNELIGNTKYSFGEDRPMEFWEVYELFTREIGTCNEWTKETYIKYSALRKASSI